MTKYAKIILELKKRGGENMVKMKMCSKCKKELPMTSEYYHKNKAKKDGLASECRECVSKYRKANKHKQKEYREKNKEKRKEWLEKNKERRSIKQREYCKKWRAKNKERIKEYNKKYKEKHKGEN